MPLTIITLRKVPNSLKGDLSKWMQEISVGVFVGNFNSRVRDKLWKRVAESLNGGEATLTYACRNEIGYTFETINSQRNVTVVDGLPLVCVSGSSEMDQSPALGFSNAYKYRAARKYSRSSRPLASEDCQSHQASAEGDAPSISSTDRPSYISIDIETDGLDYRHNRIIEVGIYWNLKGREFRYQSLIEHDDKLPKDIINLTGITDELLQEHGRSRKEVFEELASIISDNVLMGYAVDFDIRFINAELKRLELPKLDNKICDLKKYVKKEKPFLDNYRLDTALRAYDIHDCVQHRALSDAELTFKLSKKVNEFLRKHG